MRQLIALMLKFPAGHTSPNLSLKGGTPKADPAAGLLNLPAPQVYIRTVYLPVHYLTRHKQGGVQPLVN